MGGPNAGVYDAFVAKFTAPLPGDTDYDGDVDLVYLGNLAGSYGTTSGAD